MNRNATMRWTGFAWVFAAATLLATIGASAAEPKPAMIRAALSTAYERYRDLGDGKNADYIPVLAKVDPKIFGIALVTVDGRVYTIGDASTAVSMQSISKVFTLAKVIDELGPQVIEENVGVDATGQPFNSIVAIEQYRGAEMNPLVNAGAIATTSMLGGANYDEIWNGLLDWYGAFAGRTLSVDQDVYASEAATNQRNQAIAQLMYAYGHIRSDPMRATDVYTRQCAVSVAAKDLAVMAATLANGGKNPVTKRQIMQASYVPDVLAVMATAGLYDDSGKWLYSTGLPAKSGVGGAIIAVSPGRFGIAAVSPPLDAAGNSVRAQKAIADISRALHGNPYAVTPR